TGTYDAQQAAVGALDDLANRLARRDHGGDDSLVDRQLILEIPRRDQRIDGEDVNILYFPHQLKGSILIGKPSDDKWRRGGHVTSAQSGSRRAHRNLAGAGPHGL